LRLLTCVEELLPDDVGTTVLTYPDGRMVPDVGTVANEEVTEYTECTFVLDEEGYRTFEADPAEPYEVVPEELEGTDGAAVPVETTDPEAAAIGFIIVLVAPR
jgi:hypothetical protein